MAQGFAEALAREIAAGTYTPSPIKDCQADLPLDRNPQTARFTQFVLFSDPDLNARSSDEPEFLILPPYRLFRPRDPAVITDELVNPLADALVTDLPTDRLPPADRPIDDIRGVLSSVGTQLTGTRPPLEQPVRPAIDFIDAIDEVTLPKSVALGLPNLEVSEEELRREYTTWRSETQDLAAISNLDPLIKAGFISDLDFSPRTELLERLRDALRRVFLPDPYRPFKAPHPHFGLCVTFEQVWEPKGYTRGELINTISLAAGEQLTIEIHSWDKSTVRSEEELSQESELRVSETLTQRDVLTVAREFSEQTGFNFSADAKVTIPKINLPLNIGGGFSNQVNTSLNQSLKRTRERTVEAAQTVKSSRKLRVEVSREVGREQKQTRTIANTNRCHTLNYHYFEVLSNYLVTTRVASVTPCMLLPNPTASVTPAWIACHEGILKESLLDKAYLPGFAGAKVLETHKVLAELRTEDAQGGSDVSNELENALREHVRSILSAHSRLLTARRKVQKAAKSNACKVAAAAGGALGWGVCVASKAGVGRLRHVLYLALLHANDAAANGLAKLKADDENDSVKPSDALRGLFAAVTPRDYQYDPVRGAVAKGLDALGVPEKLVEALLAWGLLEWLPDDAGLYNAVKAASARLKDVLELPPAELPDSGGVRGGFSQLEIAEARVAFEQLQCHIKDNLLHYLQAIWAREHADQRFLRLQSYGSIAAILENEILGFLGHKAAYRITDLEAVKRWVNFRDIIEQTAIDPGAPQLVTVPTAGMVDETVLSSCEACEEFIQNSRRIDLRTQEANARRQEAEAKRYELRLEADPPDLSDPDAHNLNRIVVQLEGTEPSQPE